MEFVKSRKIDLNGGLIGVVKFKDSETRVTNELDTLLESEFNCKFSGREDSKRYSKNSFVFVELLRGRKTRDGVNLYKRGGVLRLGSYGFVSVGMAEEFIEFLNRKFEGKVAPMELGDSY